MQLGESGLLLVHFDGVVRFDAATSLVSCVTACVSTGKSNMEFLFCLFRFCGCTNPNIQIQMNKRYRGCGWQLDLSFQRNCGIGLMSPQKFKIGLIGCLGIFVEKSVSQRLLTASV